MLLTGPTDEVIARRLAAELTQIECRFAAELLSDLPCVNALVSHIERYRGKMLRPTLVLASGMACAPDGPGGESGGVAGAKSSCPSRGASDIELTEAHRVLATVVEMVHMATLVHDDILDDADIRRRGATVNRLSGNETAVMLGDYLISHAYHLGSSLGNAAITRLIGAATNTVCEGELLQLANRNNADVDERTYFEIIRRKTASLCGVCCKASALLHAAPPHVVQALYDYGEKLGVAFQIVDDLLDLVGQENTVGKTLGRDLQKGKLTLPLIHCLRTAKPQERAWLWDYARYGPSGAGENHADNAPASKLGATVRVRELVLERGSVAYANQCATRLAETAKAALGDLPDRPAKAMLMNMADAVVTRTY